MLRYKELYALIPERKVSEDVLYKKLPIPERPTWEVSYFEMLKERVIDTGVCSYCGTCAAICPVGRIVVEDKPIDFPNYKNKCKDCGACIRVCPRWDYQPLSGLGMYVDALAAKSTRFEGQDGGMVTEIVASAFEMGLIDRAVFVTRDENWKPKAIEIKSIEDLKNPNVRGSKYSFADVLPLTTTAALLCNRGVAVIGTPCMISGIRKLQEEDALFGERVVLTIGLFCTENFYHWQLSEFLKKRGVDISKVKRMSIEKGKFIAEWDGNRLEVPVKELKSIVPSGCEICKDFTAVEADVSVGSVGSNDGYSTILLRGGFARDVLDYIKVKGYAEFDEVNIEPIEKLAERKAKN
ncbi:F420H(2):quinone oxidoreductase [Archaeoglobales archaeon]|nr:MAG: F420H(2):quinone oxidoreductase [Archaeoglobales archaeon]